MNSHSGGAASVRPRTDERLETIRTLQAEIRQLRAGSSAQREASALLTVEVQEKILEIHRLWDALDSSTATAASFVSLNHAARALIEDLEAQVEALRDIDRISQTRLQRVRDLEASMSWRVTAPLRWISSMLRGVPRSVDASWRRLLELGYRAMPPSFAMRVKAAIFRGTGRLFSNTGAYQRWQDALNKPVFISAPAPAAPLLGEPVAIDGSSILVNHLWSADGRQEWLDYPLVRARIDAAANEAAQARTPPSPVALIDFSKLSSAEAAATIRLPAAQAPPDVSILVPVFNHLTTTLECLASIAASVEVGGPSFEIIVANDASTDASAEILAGITNLRVVNQPENLGFLRNCNAAAPTARGKYLLLLNNDVQVTSGWLSALVESLSASPDVGAVGPRIVYPSGWLQEAGTALHRDGTAEMIGLNDLPDRPRYSYPRDVDYCSGACLMLRNADFKALQGFDAHYAPAYCEDSDLCMRLRKQGKRIVYCAEATVVHHLSKTSDNLSRDYKLSCIATNLEKFTERWRPDLDRLDDVRTIAFYLPQFHPIPENDLWWGKGFTEWTNVTKAKPNFLGHYQPRIPADLGYYDLRLTDVLEQQAELARRYGVGGFCYYYYWFGGKRLLERPIEQMLETGRPDFPFCLCWANENWTRRWDGQEQDILMAQKHSDQDDRAVILDLIRFFRSPNYIKIAGKPLILVYRVTLFPDFAKTSRLWREVCREQGIGEIYIAQVESFELVSAGIKPADLGCDAAVEFPPQGMADPYPLESPLLNPNFSGVVADYRDLAVRYATRELPPYKRFMGVMPGWDNSARRQDNSYCFEHATPGAFQAWLETTIARTKRQYSGDERLVFINAWNEWAEGAYLEPDRRFGHAFLEAHANARASGHLVRNGGYSLG